MTKTETMQQVWKADVLYEIQRLVEMYRLLLEPDQYRRAAPTGPIAVAAFQINDTLDDALIVAFCTHARNLLEFFYHAPTDWHATATDYANASYVPPARKDLKPLLDKLNEQINHLTYMRTEETDQKIGPKERREIISVIGLEAVRLQQQLKPGYDAKCLQIEDLQAAAAIVGLSPAGRTGTNKSTLGGVELA